MAHQSVGDHVGSHLGVRLGSKLPCGILACQRRKVGYHPIVNDQYFTIVGKMWVGVYLCDTTMSSPTSVAQNGTTVAKNFELCPICITDSTYPFDGYGSVGKATEPK